MGRGVRRVPQKNTDTMPGTLDIKQQLTTLFVNKDLH